MAVYILTRGLIAGGTVDNDRGTGQGVPDTGRRRNPYILADFHTHGKPFHVAAAEQQVRTHGDLPVLPCHKHRPFIAGTEMARLVKFRIVGEMLLGHDSQKLSSLDNSSHIEKLVLPFPWKSHKHQDIPVFRCAYDAGQFLPCL